MKPDNPVYKKRDNRIEIADLISLYRSKWPAFLIQSRHVLHWLYYTYTSKLQFMRFRPISS